MSLRARLTLLNIALLGAVLLLFGTSVFRLVSVILVNEIDENLRQTANEITQFTSVNRRGELDIITLPQLDLTANVYVQAWSRDGRLRNSSLNINTLRTPLDSAGMQSPEPVYRDSLVGNARLRVLSVPLVIGERPVGILQVGQSLSVVNEAQRIMLIVMVSAAGISIIVAGLASWLTTERALSPLAVVTKTAMEITRTNDLSRRIPNLNPIDQEIGQLIEAFNQTLSRLERLIRSQRRFLTDVGHEFRTPLTVIRGNVDLMQHVGAMDPEALESIQLEVDRLTRLVGDLLLLAQAESGKLPLDRRIVELDTVLLDVFRQAQVLAKDKLKLRIGEIDQVQVCGDQDRLNQVLLNLISNAIKYTPDGGQVVVSLAKTAQHSRVTVSDSGPGIPPQDLPHIFDRFYRGEKSRLRTRDGKGFGLGLSIAYWIIRNHDGRIEVNSQIGQGTTFIVWLPLAQGGCEDTS